MLFLVVALRRFYGAMSRMKGIKRHSASLQKILIIENFQLMANDKNNKFRQRHKTIDVKRLHNLAYTTS